MLVDAYGAPTHRVEEGKRQTYRTKIAQLGL